MRFHGAALQMDEDPHLRLAMNAALAPQPFRALLRRQIS